MEMIVGSVSVETALDRIARRHWQIPQFQRDFVWEVNNVIALVTSIFESRPIGMATLWTQSPNSVLQLEPISVPDSNEFGFLAFSVVAENPPQVYAVIDGKQRCTALAMAFGGLKPTSNRRKYSGRYFLSVTPTNDNPWEVKFIRETFLQEKGLTVEANCFAAGLFPLSSYIKGENFVSQWMRYVGAVDNQSNYPTGKFPSDSERTRRREIIQKCFRGLVETKLATYTLPDHFTLAEICDIFEKLNTTGTRVSTVDLIHSWLYNESTQAGKPFLLREWIDEFGEKDGAIGWSQRNNRPELIVQIVTACQVALESPPAPRPITSKTAQITSVKSADLLATPIDHWNTIAASDEQLARFLGDFQDLVAGGPFPFDSCPYPVSAAVYVALRWHHRVDQPTWGISELDSLYRAFFWRNALAQRYDQGFLTQLGTDIREIKKALQSRLAHPSSSSWATEMDKWLTRHFDRPVPDRERLIDWLTNTRPAGAVGLALTLPMKARVTSDIVDTSISLRYPDGQSQAELHHIYPRQWCADNKVGPLRALLDVEVANRNWVESVANLMPLSRKSNNAWKKKHPEQYIHETQLSFEPLRTQWERVFIDKRCFDLLIGTDHASVGDFWRARAGLIADDLISRMEVQA